MSDEPAYSPGLAGVPCARSAVCYLDGTIGKLQYRGYPIEKLAEVCTFEEIVHLLLFGELPSRATLEGFSRELASLRAHTPEEVTQRIWGRPTFEVHGIAGGYQDEGIKTVVPPYGEAKVSMRLVPPQDPDECVALLAAHVRKINPDVEVTNEKGLKPYSGARTGPYAEAASDALEFGFGARPAFTREGGSIGAVLSMEKVLKAPVFFLGLSLPEHGYHAPNENYDWPQAEGGMAAFADYFRRLAAM